METKEIKKSSTTIKVVTEHENIFTILQIINDDKKMYKIAVGDAIISNNEFTSVKDAKNYIDSKPYEILVNLICLTNERMKNYETK